MEQSLRVALLGSDSDVRTGRRMLISSLPNLEIVLDSTGEETDVSSVANGLVDVLVIDQRLAFGPGVDFYAMLRNEMGIKQAPGCLITAAFDQPALKLAAFELGIDHLVSIENGPKALIEAIQQVSVGESGVLLDTLHDLISAQAIKRKLDLDFVKLTEQLPEKLASNLRRLRSVWIKGNPNQLRDFPMANLDGLVARLPVRNASELIVKAERTGLFGGE
jgi:DNA-binding NarL/FixJ family response regulator